VHLVGFIIRIYHDARSPERISYVSSTFFSLVDCSHKRVENISIQGCMYNTVFLMMDIRCSKHVEENN